MNGWIQKDFSTRCRLFLACRDWQTQQRFYSCIIIITIYTCTTISITMLRFTTLALIATTVTASAVPSLTPENYDKLTEGKTVFLKFFAPWVSTVVCAIIESYITKFSVRWNWSWTFSLGWNLSLIIERTIRQLLLSAFWSGRVTLSVDNWMDSVLMWS